MLLVRESLVLAIPEREAGSWPEQPKLADLNRKPFLMYSPYEAYFFYQLVMGLLDRAGVKPEVVEYVGQIHTMLALVNSGMGVALIP